MRVTSNAFSNSLVDQIQRLGQQQFELQAKLASGQRVTNPDDDPAAMSRIIQSQSDKRELVQFRRNHNRADGILNITFNNIDSVRDINVRAQEIAALAGGITSDDDLKLYSVNINELLEQAVQVGNVAFNGEHLFAGNVTDAPPYTVTRNASGSITSVSYDGGVASSEFLVAEGTSLSPYSDVTDNAAISSLMNRLVALRDALDVGDRTAVATSRVDLASSEDDILLAISEIGAKMLRLEVIENQDNQRYIGLENEISKDADADITKTVLKLNQTQSAYESALRSGAKILSLSLLDFI